MQSVSSLRAWLRTMSANEVRTVLARQEAAHGPASIRYPDQPVARKTATDAGMRVWVVKAPSELLTCLARCGALMAGAQLRHMGFSDEAVDDPDIVQLKEMLRVLPMPMAGLALYGLAIHSDSFPAGPLVRGNWDVLWEAVMVPASEPGEQEYLMHHDAEEDSAERTGGAPAGEPLQQQELPASDVVEPDSVLTLVERIEQTAQRVRADGAALAERLDALAVAVREGRDRHDPVLGEEVGSWHEDRTRVAELAGQLEVPDAIWGPGDSYDALELLIGHARELEDRRSQELENRTRELAEVRAAHGKYLALLNEEPLEVVREGLRGAITGLEDRIRELEAAISPGAVPDPHPNGPADETPEPFSGPAEGNESPSRVAMLDSVMPGTGGDNGTETGSAYEDGQKRRKRPAQPKTGIPAPDATPGTAPQPVLPDEDQLPEEPQTQPQEGRPQRDAHEAAAPSLNTQGQPIPSAVEAQAATDTRNKHTGQSRSHVTLPSSAENARRRAEKRRRPEENEQPLAPSESEEGSASTSAASAWSASEAGPSTVEQFIRQVQFAEAYWLSRAVPEPAHRIQALSFAHQAFRLPDAQAGFELQLKADGYDFPTPSDDREAYLVALAAALRSGLSAGWASTLVTEFAPLPGLPPAWADLLQKLVTEVRQGMTIEPGEALRTSATDPAVHRTELAERARQLQEDLPLRKITLQRGTKVLQTMCRDGVLGRTLRLVQDWAEGRADAQALEQDMEQHYSRADAVDRLIDAADRATRSPKQGKESIHSTAREQLRNHVKTVADLLHEAKRVTDLPQHGRGREIDAELNQAVTAAIEAEAPAGPGGAALQVLVRWLAGQIQPSPLEEGRAAYTDCLLALPDLTWRDHDGEAEPDLDEPGAATALLALTQPVETDAALASHLKQGNIHLARRLLTALENGSLHGAGKLPAGELAKWQQKTEDSAADWKDRLRAGRGQAEALLAHIRVQNLLSPELESKLSGQMMDLERGDLEDRYGSRDAATKKVVAELRGLVERKTGDLRSQLAVLSLEEESARRISALLDADDVVTAEELLSFARQGHPLPERQPETGAELEAFLAGVRHPKAPTAGGTGVGAHWWAQHYAADRPLVESTQVALDSWTALADPRSRSNAYQKHVGSVLRLLGLRVNQVSLDEVDRKDWSVLRLNVRAEVSESVPGYVAALGSQAQKSYRVLVISDEQRGEGPLRHLPESAQGAHIILYLQPLGVEGRRRLAQRSRNRPQQAIVVDPAVIGWIAAREPRSFRAVQRVTLPWAAYVPYAPYLAGRVPAEVFKGRDTEKSAIMGRDGSLFLYGGRQLGKSSLLRQVVDIFERDSEDHVAVYFDLRSADIGYAEPPEQIWSVLTAELKRRGLFGSKLSERADADTIASHIRKWIEDKPVRRLLVLADEADAFLNADARPVETEGGQSTFRTVKRLQQLMQDTNRGFKVVFAGLHQVQRYNRLTNVITAHGGPGMLVGPLRPKSAVELVVEPLASVGLFFAAPDLVWRILALTNYQANLVQIFCEGLVGEMQERALTAEGSRPQITEADVQKVAASQGIRSQIRDRLRLTIDLEDRYRVLTLILALRSLRDGYARGYAPQELLDEAYAVWPDGFPPQNGVNEARIDLEEMQGLGLVIQLHGGRDFAMRSPNVVNMLGTREELDAELQTTEFSQPYDYNPRVARRSLGADRSHVERMSPLTEEQWHEALSAGTAVVAASSAMGADLILRAAGLHVGSSRKILRYGPSDDLAKGITEHTRLRVPHLLLVDLRGEPLPRIQEAVERLASYTGVLGQERPSAEADGAEIPRRRALVITDPLSSETLAGKGAVLVRPQRWNATSVRAWPESPFLSAEERRNLIDATGGWPAFVERVMHNVRNGHTRDTALALVRNQIDSQADHLYRAGLDDATVSRLGLWADMFTVNEHQTGNAPATPQDLDVVLECGLDRAEELLNRLEDLGVLDESPNGVTVEPVIFRLLKALQQNPEGDAK
ncbi:AAA family ATPase [Streptomyces sp. NPDC059466]|uniref:AAA family ATPase n=1 Tax=unclassified Streptomyces TaxID=2593676 RepID=UPI0036A22CB6